MSSPLLWFGSSAKLLKSILRIPGSTSGTFSMQTPSAVTDYTVTLPSTQGGVSTFLKNDGSGGLTWASGTFSPAAPTRQIFTSGSGTYTTPSSPTPLYLKVTIIGGGGGSGGSTAGQSAGGGGGGGGGSIFYISSPSASYSYVVGAGGTAGTTSVTGGTGGTSTFSTASATGGTGGVAGTTGNGTPGGPGGVGSSGTINFNGQGGQAGGASVGGTFADSAGIGGSSFLGGGAYSIGGNTPGSVAGNLYGGGAAGFGGNGAGSGAAGAAGIIIVEEFYQ